uniref:Uncharacterized protein n=1 Tax=Ascaris lumbricoides TaxID=6252 RepID=A0A0M3IGF5_ASCLU
MIDSDLSIFTSNSSIVIMIANKIFNRRQTFPIFIDTTNYVFAAIGWLHICTD